MSVVRRVLPAYAGKIRRIVYVKSLSMYVRYGVRERLEELSRRVLRQSKEDVTDQLDVLCTRGCGLTSYI